MRESRIFLASRSWSRARIGSAFWHTTQPQESGPSACAQRPICTPRCLRRVPDPQAARRSAAGQRSRRCCATAQPAASPRLSHNLDNASSRGRDDASKSASTPLLVRAPAAEPLTPCDVRLRGLLAPATPRESKRGPANDGPRQPDDSWLLWAVHIGEVVSGGRTTAGEAGERRKRMILREIPA